MRRTTLALALAALLPFPAVATLAAPHEVPSAPAGATPDAAALAEYAQALLAKNYPADGPGAAVLVARGDEILFRGAAGRDEVGRDDPLRPEDTFRLGSVTKQFAAAAVLKLVEAGKVKLDDPLTKYVADYPNGRNITVRQLLDHTSGVKSYTSIPGMMEGPIRKDVDTAQLIASFKDEKPDFAPGEGWLYNNSGYVLVGAVIEAASGQPWHEYLEETFFEPLGMRHTGYGHDPSVAKAQVHGWAYDGGKPVPAAPLSMTQPHAAGALVSNVDDLLRWNRALHEGKLLTPEHYALMTTPAGKAAAAHYGYGIGTGTVRGQPLLTHGGGIFGFSTTLGYVPGPDITVAVLQNADGAPAGKDGPDVLARRLMAQALGSPYPVPVPIAVAPEALQELQGVYRVDEHATRTLRVVDGQLTSQRSGGSRSVLTPIGRDEFLYEDGFNRFTVERDAAGKVTGMRFYEMGEGAGVVAARTADPLPAERQALTLPVATLQRLVGNYEGMGTTLKVFLDGETLKTQLADQPAFVLHAESAHRFFLKEVDAALEFAQGDDPAAKVTLHQGPQPVEFTRAP
jgi:D-alanyl-D-alanine carboxypeptidase